MRIPVALALPVLSTPPLAARTCSIDLAAVEARIAGLEPAYGLVLSDIGCDAPTVPAHVLICGAAEQSRDELWRMGRLHDLAWPYAVENATGQEVDPANPPREAGFLAARDACADAACLCDILTDHTNANLGGTSPCPQQAGPAPVSQRLSD